MQNYQGKRDAKKLKIAIIVAKFNKLITEQLLKGAVDALIGHGAEEASIEVYWVPGCFEIPLVAKQLVTNKDFHAIITLGAVIRGQTPHFDYVATQVSSGVAQTALESQTPIIFGILTTDTTEQALERAGIKGGNKGYDAALAALEMASLMSQIVPTALKYSSSIQDTRAQL